MKATINRAKLLDAFNIVSAVPPDRSPKEILKNVKIDITNGAAAVLSATDLENSVSISVPQIEIDEPGVVLVPVGRFGSILRESSDDTLRLDGDGKDLTVTGARSRYKMPTAAATEFPSLDFPLPDSYIELTGGLLQSLIQRAIFATSAGDSRYALGGVKFEFDGKLAQMRTIATDGRRLAKVVGNAGSVNNATLGDNIIIPARSLKLIEKIVSGTEIVRFYSSQNDVVIKSDTAMVRVRILEGRFPRWKDVFPSDNGRQKFDLTVGPFSQAVKQAAIATSEESKGVNFTFGDGQVDLQASAAEIGESNVEMPIFNTGVQKVTVTLDPKFVGDFLRVLPDDKTFTLSIRDADSAVQCSVDDGLDYIIMPLSRE